MDKVRIAIMDDHQSVIDGYLFRLRDTPKIEIVGTVSYGDDLEPLLANHTIDVLLLDVSVPISEQNPNPTPILYIVPKLLQRYPEMAIIIISMHTERPLIKALTAAGVSGYILKDDHFTIRQLGWAILSVANGGMYFSKQAHKLLLNNSSAQDMLTPRQIEVLNLFTAYPHLTTAAAALELNVAHSTVRNLLSDIYLRLDVPNRSAAIIKAQKIGLVPSNISVELKHLTQD
ncbi:MAG TPA: response regulator transcription factor [Anaerolineae bacterium]|nr:response regulator transcription factor [Anaerolineae bacterium]